MKIFLFALLCLIAVAQAGEPPAMAPASHSTKADMLIRFHGNRIHIKVIPEDKTLYPHIVKATLCSAKDLNMGKDGCETDGFISKTLVVPDQKDRVPKSNYDARLPSSGSGISFKPVQVIKDWPLVYVELLLKMKQKNGKWEGNGEIIRKIERIDRANAVAGKAFGMETPEADRPWWQLWALGSLAGLLGLLLIISGVKRRITTAMRRVQNRRLWSEKSDYHFAGGREASGSDFRELYNQTKYPREAQKEKEAEERLNMMQIAKDTGFLVDDNTEIDWL